MYYRARKGSLQSAALDDLPIANQDGTGAVDSVQLIVGEQCRPRGGSASPIRCPAA
jgi:hypothetical protein